jgi:hypothetical protein
MSEGIDMSHVFLCTICGHKIGRLLMKGKCSHCRNKSLVMYASDSSPEFLKKYRAVNRQAEPCTPMQTNLLVTVIIAAGLGLGALVMHYFHDWTTTRATLAALPYTGELLKYLPEDAAPTRQKVASGANTLH